MATDKGRPKSDRRSDDENDDDEDEVFTRSEDEAGRRALARERRAAREAKREAAELRERLDALEGKDASDVERLKAENEKLKGERDAALLRADRLDVAIRKGLTLAQAKRLVGNSVEELEDDADEILEAFPTKAQRSSKSDEDDDDADNGEEIDDRATKSKDDDRDGRPPSRRPRSDLRGGRDPSDDPKGDEMDPAKLAELIPRP